ncbi:MAG: hypothetical protein EP326_05395 [Deltaproteobacteria bacterium]|nr:MAG: hypothetical protein EP326_05395 [Deltaproteobacteria bacterium]TNF31061.1 MAG: hypothetical protein EP319_03245 [Deltaproteobacteria bacterium]
MFTAKRYLTIGLALCLLSFNASAGAGKLIDVLVNDTGLLELLGKNGIKGTAAKRASDYVTLSWKSLNQFGDRLPTKTEIKTILASISGSSEDIKIRNALREVLEKPADSMKKDDIVTAINNLIWLANRHGKRGSIVLACSACVSDTLSGHGFKFTLEVLSNASAAKVLNDVLPRNPKSLRNFISERMGTLGMGDFSRASTDLVGPEEERALGLFLGLAEYGTAQEKRLVEAILEVSKTPEGKVELLNPKNPHKLWKLFSDPKFKYDNADDWSDMLSKIARNSDGQENKKEAFFKYLKEKAGDDPFLNEQLNKVRAKKCFFR